MKIFPSPRCRTMGLAALSTLVPAFAAAQLTAPAVGAVEAGLLLRGLDGEKRVLMVGAHPDDEDTSMLAALSLGQGVRTAYLSLNRGEGGQNLIGPELDEGLGIVRTGELLSARSLDGAEQFFTRAFDFGFSKSAEETFLHWPQEEILRDVTWVIRSFRPHVIVSVFSGTPQDGHGHHQAAGIMTREAFDVAGDPSRFSDQLSEGVDAWEPLKLVQLRRGGTPENSTVLVETGRLDPLLGRSHHQIAMESRSRHRSQDMGAAQAPGPRASGAFLIESRVTGEVDESDGLFAGIDTTLAGLARRAGAAPADEAALVAAVEGFRREIRRAADMLHPSDPERAKPPLTAALDHLNGALALAGAAPEGPARRELQFVLESRQTRTARALLAAAGVVVDVRADRDQLVPGEAFQVEVLVWNGGSDPIRVASTELILPEGWIGVEASTQAGPVPAGALREVVFRVTVPDDAKTTRPYYLREDRDGGLYRWPGDPSLRGLPGDPPLFAGRVLLEMGGAEPVAVIREGSHVGVDKAAGEYRVPIFVVPPVGVEIDRGVMAWPTDRTEARPVTVRVSQRPGMVGEGVLTLEAPPGWEVTPAFHQVAFTPGGGESGSSFEIRPGSEVGDGLAEFRAVLRVDGREYREAPVFVDYPHIDPVPMYRPASLLVSRFPVSVAEGLRVGYIMGPGDGGMQALRDLGFEVEALDADAVRAGAYSEFDVIVLGIRTYETRTDLIAANERLVDFARSGGTVVVQYNKYEYPDGGFAPFPIQMSRPHDRVTNPGADVTFLVPDHPLLTTPNRLMDADFGGWIQERGLYFLREWDDRYTPLLGMADVGEPMNRGSLVVAPVGQGVYIYTGLSLFRQIPAGVPGAYRILANLVSIRGADL